MSETAVGLGINLLIVEDEADLMYLLNEVFGRLGFGVHQVTSGNRALAFLKDPTQPKIDAILSDIVMPDGNGFELATQLMLNDSKIPVFLMSDKANENKIGTTFPGIADVFLKPFRPKEIAPIIRDWVERRRKGGSLLDELFPPHVLK